MRNNRRQLNKCSSANKFVCRLCRKKHPLRTCRRFLNMNIEERKDVVVKYGYCVNCLAHIHSDGSCFTKTGCRYCKLNHHSLLHIHPRLSRHPRNNASPPRTSKRVSSKSPTRQPSTSSKRNRPHSTSKSDSASLSAILKQNVITLLPTAIIKIEHQNMKHAVRCLLDSGSKISCISKGLVDKYQLITLELDGEVICPLSLHSNIDSGYTLEVTLRVNSRICSTTPSETLPTSVRKHFENLVLADKSYYKSSSVDLILGVDIFSRIIKEGSFIRTGLPSALNTVFGVIIFGTISI